MYALMKTNSRYTYLLDLNNYETLRFNENDFRKLDLDIQENGILCGNGRFFPYNEESYDYNFTLPDIVVNSGLDALVLLRFNNSYYMYYREAYWVVNELHYSHSLKELSLNKVQFSNLCRAVRVRVVELSEEKYNSYIKVGLRNKAEEAKFKLLYGIEDLKFESFTDLLSKFTTSSSYEGLYFDLFWFLSGHTKPENNNKEVVNIFNLPFEDMDINNYDSYFSVRVDLHDVLKYFTVGLTYNSVLNSLPD